MYIEKKNAKRPISFPEILNAKVFECNGKYYLKATYGDAPVAVDLEEGKVLNPGKDDFTVAYLYPGAVMCPEGARKDNA